MVPRSLSAYADGEITPIDDTLDVAPCIACGRPASPCVETDAGVWCLTCADGPDVPPPAKAAVRDVRLARTCRCVACTRLSRELAFVS